MKEATRLTLREIGGDVTFLVIFVACLSSLAIWIIYGVTIPGQLNLYHRVKPHIENLTYGDWTIEELSPLDISKACCGYYEVYVKVVNCKTMEWTVGFVTFSKNGTVIDAGNLREGMKFYDKKEHWNG